MSKKVEGFSKFSKTEKIEWITQSHFDNPENAKNLINSYNHSNLSIQKLHDEFIENSITNFYLPLGVAPNFLINGTSYTIPMAIEESSVIAAASKSAKFWASKGGFKANVIGTEKIGQVHFLFKGKVEKLNLFFKAKKQRLLDSTSSITSNMRNRGGGITGITLIDKTDLMEEYFQLHLTFETVDSMGANFINSCLEQIAKTLQSAVSEYDDFTEEEKQIEVVMSILSNYVPGCLVHASVSCPVDQLEDHKGLTSQAFAKKFIRAVEVAKKEPYRAVTHNKGIMNGIDAVVIATGNDFRAVEAAAHAYASKKGSYTSLSNAYIEDNNFVFEIKLPLALGTVGGLTQLHPLVKWSMELLGNPNSINLMEIIAVAGLAQNFAAIRSLVTSGIQQGHMKMHLLNILNQKKATEVQKEKAIIFFKTNTVSFSAVSDFLKSNS
jgi:hydroxymethylglutaryl-CoA reductase